MRRPHGTEAAYAAGLFDGEGHCAIYPQKRSRTGWQVTITIAQNDTRPLHWLVEIFGGSIFKQSGHLCSKWMCTSQAQQLHFLLAIQEFCLVKREQVDAAIKFLTEECDLKSTRVS